MNALGEAVMNEIISVHRIFPEVMAKFSLRSALAEVIRIPLNLSVQPF